MMRKVTLALVFLLVVGLAASVPAAQQERRAMTVDDALSMVGVDDPLISPDGEWVLYSRRELDWEENEYDTEHWIVPADGGDAYRYIGEEGGSDFRFSPDGRYLTFKRKVGEGDDATQQLFWMRTAGGEAIQLTEHATSIGRYDWGDDSKRIFFVADDERPKEEKEALEKGSDAIFVDEGPNGQTRDYWSNIWVLDVESEQERKITDEEFLVTSFDPSPEGDRIAFGARYTNRRNDADKIELYVADVESGEMTRLTDNGAPEGGVLWRPGADQFLYEAADDRDWLNRNDKLWLMDVGLAEHRLLSGAFEGNIYNPVFTPDGSAVLFTGQQGVSTDLIRMDVETGEFEKVTDLPGWITVASYSADRSRFAYSWSDHDTSQDLYAASVAAPDDAVRLTHANPWVQEELKLADLRVIQWESADGREIEGLLHLPPDYEEGQAYPLMLNIHGGPAGFFSNSWNGLRGAAYHIYGGQGFVSLSANVRGSSGYTDHLREGNTVDAGDGIGKGDFQDLMTGIDYLIEQGIVDPEHMALRGWSYGGILGGWTITQTDRFAAASIGAGVYDWTSEYGPGFNNDVRLWHIGGTPWDNPEGYRQQSALTHVANVTTPTILFHGMNDTTDTEQQSMMFFTALKDIGKAPTRYLRVPREPHGFREPRHQRQLYTREIEWMQQHVLGNDWEIPEPKWAEEDDGDECECEEEENGDDEM